MLPVHIFPVIISFVTFFKFYARLLLVIILGLFPKLNVSQAQAPPPITYPKVAGYVAIIHPLVTLSKEGTTTNFDEYYVVGMPAGINI